MHLQVLSSGSGGNATLVRAGDTCVLVDAGLPLDALEQRLEAARAGPRLDHVFVTHGHLDHARSAGLLARKRRATLHCAEAVMRNGSIRRCRTLSAFTIGRASDVDGPRGSDGLRLTPVHLPHDAAPTVAFRIQHHERTAVVLTDMGTPRPEVASALAGAHLLVLEFNHDEELLERGPYPFALKRRIRGNQGHLSNAQACEMLRLMASAQLHTLVLAHLSEHNNRPELALDCALSTLASLGLGHVRVLVAPQHAALENLAV